MQKITVYLFKAEMASLINLIHPPTYYSTQAALNTLSLEEITLVEWRGRFTPNQLLTWHRRDYRKQYPVNMPVSLAVALWKVLRNLPLSPDLQSLSDALDKSLINSGFTTKYLHFSDYD